MTEYAMPKPPKHMFWTVDTRPGMREINVRLWSRPWWQLCSNLEGCAEGSATLDPELNARTAVALGLQVLQELQDRVSYADLNGLTGYVRGFPF